MSESKPPEQEKDPIEQSVFKEEVPDTDKNNTSSGLDEKVAGLLSYIFFIGIIFIFIEKENTFIRFHAFQGVFTFITLFVGFSVLGMIPILGWIIAILLSPVSLLLAIFLMYQAYNKKKYKLPIIGDLAEKYATAK